MYESALDNARSRMTAQRIERMEQRRIDDYAEGIIPGWDSVETSVEDIPVCTDCDMCKCDCCREINAGIRDGKRADTETRIMLELTAKDIMSDGKPRFASDLYWQGILTGITL